jgi:hypothetical protein
MKILPFTRSTLLRYTLFGLLVLLSAASAFLVTMPADAIGGCTGCIGPTYQTSTSATAATCSEAHSQSLALAFINAYDSPPGCVPCGTFELSHCTIFPGVSCTCYTTLDYKCKYCNIGPDVPPVP